MADLRDDDVIFDEEGRLVDPPHNEHEWTRHYYLEGLRLSREYQQREMNAHVADPFRSLLNDFFRVRS